MLWLVHWALVAVDGCMGWGRAGQLTQTEVSQGIFYYELEVRKEQVMQIYKRKHETEKKEIRGK